MKTRQMKHLLNFSAVLVTLVAGALCAPASGTEDSHSPQATGSGSPTVVDAAPAPTVEATAPVRPPFEFKDPKDRTSYAVGISTGRALRTADGGEVNIDAFVRGLRDGLDAVKAQMSERQLTDLLGKFQQTLRQKMAASRARASIDNAKAAEEFLKSNKDQPGVVSMGTGVQYKILQAGTGTLPQENDVVTVKFRGTLLNGNEFDSTPGDAPVNLNVNTLVAGWKQVLKVMPVGSHWKIFIPPELGYGARGVGAEVGPNELLIFDLELLATRDTTGPGAQPAVER